MAESPNRQAYVLLFAAGLAIRLAAMVGFGAWELGSLTAHHEHDSIAANLAAGRGFRFNFFGDINNPSLTSQQAPFVPGMLATAFLIFGIGSKQAYLAMLLVQCVASAFTVVGIAWLASRVTRSKTGGAAAGALAAVYPPLVISPLHIQALVWNLAWLTLLLASSSGLASSTRWGSSIFVVVAVGGILTDPILAVVVGVLWILMFFGAIGLGRRTRIFALAVFIALGLAPWTYRNYQVHGRWIFIKDSFGYVFWQGNNPASRGTDKLSLPTEMANKLTETLELSAAHDAVVTARQGAVSVDITLPAEFIHKLQQLPSEIQRMDRFAERAWNELAADPARYVMLCGLRLRQWLWFDETNPRSMLWHYRVSYWTLVALAFAGIFCSRRELSAFRVLGLSGVALTLVHVLIITSARFRILFELLLIVPAGVGIHASLCAGLAMVRFVASATVSAATRWRMASG